MINSLPLELMDESSIITRAGDRSVFSPLFVHKDVLLQVLLVPADTIDVAKLWVPEGVRQHMHVDMEPDIADGQLTVTDCL